MQRQRALPSTVDAFAEVVTSLRKAEAFLRTEPMRHGMAWIDGGLKLHSTLRHAPISAPRWRLVTRPSSSTSSSIAWAQDRANNYEF